MEAKATATAVPRVRSELQKPVRLAGGWWWFVLRGKLQKPVRLAGGWWWFVLRGKYCWLLAERKAASTSYMLLLRPTRSYYRFQHQQHLTF
jgi:hypothetical protein